MSESKQTFMRELDDRTDESVMSESKQTFMHQLDDWTDEPVVAPLWDSFPGNEDDREAQQIFFRAVKRVKKAIREKVLTSYRNGQQAGPDKPKQSKPKPTAKAK